MNNLKPDKVWKGKQYQNIIIKTNDGEPACGAYFEIGKEVCCFCNQP